MASTGLLTVRKVGSRKAETSPPVAMGHIRGHDCRGLGGLQQDRRIVSVDAALTEEEIGFLQELVDAGEVGCTIRRRQV